MSKMPLSLPLWENAVPLAVGREAEDIPTLTFFPPAGQPSGASIIVCPGGGYGRLAPHEGEPIARWLASLGILGVVLKYRHAPRYKHPAPLLDAARAVRTLRSHAGDWQIDPQRIGIMGSSAGGHLAATLSTHFDAGNPAASDAIERASSRPNLTILLYAVVSMKGHGHEGSRKNLLGDSPPAQLVETMSNETQVTAQTPPTFLFHTVEDPAVPVENSIYYALALRKAGVAFEMHCYEKGRHGVGLAQDDAALRTWPGVCGNWLAGQNFTTRKK